LKELSDGDCDMSTYIILYIWTQIWAAAEEKARLW